MQVAVSLNCFDLLETARVAKVLRVRSVQPLFRWLQNTLPSVVQYLRAALTRRPIHNSFTGYGDECAAVSVLHVKG